MRQLVFASLLLLVASVAPAADSSRPPADAHELIRRVLSSYGGRNSLNRIKCYRAQGRVTAVMTGREGPTIRVFQRPNKLRVELQYDDAPETRIVDGDHGWRGEPGNMTPASGAMLDAMALQAARADLPWLLIEREKDARLIEPVQYRGKSLAGLEVSLGPGLAVRAYIDLATNRIEVSRGIMDRDSSHTEFQTVYSDFRWVNHIQFAFHEESFASGTKTGVTTLEKLEWNPTLTPADFQPAAPAKGDT